MSTDLQNNNKIVLEENKRLSECLLWQMQRDYFDQQGINAWVNQVPFYITSNPFIAKVYAKIVIRFIRDWVTKHPEAKKHPFYILELGTGSGRFSFYALKAIHELKQEFGMDDINILYIMSDFTVHNLEYHQTHPALLPYIDKGLVDFAIYDMETDKHIHLIRSNLELDAKTLVNPLSIFANYIFDTVSQDSFSVENGKLYELKVSLSTEADNLQNNKPIDWQKITIDRHAHEIHGNYYNDPQLDSLLDAYKNNLIDTSFLIPIGAIRALNILKQLTADNFFLIASDKAYSEMAALENLAHPSFAFHGSFSMMVNFHAIGNYLLNSGGDFFPQSVRRGIKTCVFSSGFRFSELPETPHAVKEYINGFSPADYFNYHRHMTDVVDKSDLDVLASHLQLSEWDPYIFSRMSSRISSIEEGDSDSIKFLTNNMHKIAENYYYMPKSDCVLFEIGVFYHSIKNYEAAQGYYKQAEQYIGENFGLLYNMALCLHHLEKNTEALTYFRRSVELDTDSKEAKEWVSYLEKMSSEKKYQPKDIQR